MFVIFNTAFLLLTASRNKEMQWCGRLSEVVYFFIEYRIIHYIKIALQHPEMYCKPAEKKISLQCKFL